MQQTRKKTKAKRSAAYSSPEEDSDEVRWFTRELSPAL